MSAWTENELARIGRAEEVQVASRRPDGSLRPFVTIWLARVGDHLYVRSAHGHDNPWFQRALNSGQGRIRAARVECDIAFEVPEADVSGDVTAAYHAKYDHYGQAMVGTVVSPDAVRSTFRLVPK
jgi:hypothetical protein